MVKTHMKRCSTSLIIREMQVKTAMRTNLTPARMAIIKKPTNNKCWRRCEEREPSYTVGNTNLCSHYGEEYEDSLNKLHIEVLYYIQSSNPTPGHISRENHNSKRYMNPNIHCSTIYNSQDMETI